MSGGAPHRRATSATEDDNLHDESPHTDSALATPHRDDLPDGPELPQDDRHLPRRTTLDTAVSNAADDLEAALNATAGPKHSPMISGVPAIYAPGLDCCQQSSSPTGTKTGGPNPCAQQTAFRARPSPSVGGGSLSLSLATVPIPV